MFDLIAGKVFEVRTDIVLFKCRLRHERIPYMTNFPTLKKGERYLGLPGNVPFNLLEPAEILMHETRRFAIDARVAMELLRTDGKVLVVQYYSSKTQPSPKNWQDIKIQIRHSTATTKSTDSWVSMPLIFDEIIDAS